MIKIKSNDSIVAKSEDDSKSEEIVDTRFLSYTRVYIHDLLNSEIIDTIQTKRGIIKINGMYLHKVSICGSIVSVYISEKYYRLKVDDSTGVVSVTLWKNCILDDSSSLETCSNKLLQNSSSQKLTFETFKPKEVYDMIEFMRNELEDKRVNNSVMYEPKQGDLVLIKANVQHFKERIELSATSCVRLQNSIEELTQIMLPAILAEKCYSIDPPSVDKDSDIVTMKYEEKENKPDENNRLNKNIIEAVYDRLVDFVRSEKFGNGSNEGNYSCNYNELYNSLKNSCKLNGLGFIDRNQVLNALKLLEMDGRVYSCQDNFHFLPI